MRPQPDPRNGASKDRQVYRCGNCQRYYTHGAAYTRPSAADREPAVAMHGEGVSQSAITRIVGVTPPAVRRWVKRCMPPTICAGGASGGAPVGQKGGAAGDSSVGKAQRAGDRR